jgi:NADPH-dependent 2,4-dienoyl-CoA reductase/sulfur reductase-like enzyme
MVHHNRAIVIGGGIAGVATVAALRAGGYDGGLVLIDAAEFPYDRPPLSKDYLSGTRNLKQIALQQREWYGEQRIDLVGLARAIRVAPADDSVEVTLEDGRSLVGDWLVLATGGRAALPPVPGLDVGQKAGKVHVLREAADADRLRAALTPGARLLVVGGGLIGAEAASTAHRLGCRVVLVDPLDPPLAGAVGTQVARWLHAQHTENDIETLTTVLESVQPCYGGSAAKLKGEPSARQFDAILVGAGMVPVTELAEAAGLEVDGGVVVDDGRVTSHPRVLAAGDSARLRGQRRIGHWEAARHDGQRAAATILGVPPSAAAAPWWWSDRHERHVEGVGEMHEPDAGTIVVLRGELGIDPFSAFTLRDGLVVGAVAVDDPGAVRAARRLIDRGIRVDPDRLADPATDLRKLLRG